MAYLLINIFSQKVAFYSICSISTIRKWIPENLLMTQIRHYDVFGKLHKTLDSLLHMIRFLFLNNCLNLDWTAICARTFFVLSYLLCLSKKYLDTFFFTNVEFMPLNVAIFNTDFPFCSIIFTNLQFCSVSASPKKVRSNFLFWVCQ